MPGNERRVAVRCVLTFGHAGDLPGVEVGSKIVSVMSASTVAWGRLDDVRDAELLDVATLAAGNRRYRKALVEICERPMAHAAL
jgi:hypothetical protein